jgi:hypothetical protein
VVQIETVSIRLHSSTGFVHVAIREFPTNGIIVHGVMVQDLRHILPRERPVSDIMPNVNTAKESLCVLCVIAPGAVGKSESHGSPGLFLKYAVVVDGLWIRLFGVVVPGADKILQSE